MMFSQYSCVSTDQLWTSSHLQVVDFDLLAWWAWSDKVTQLVPGRATRSSKDLHVFRQQDRSDKSLQHVRKSKETHREPSNDVEHSGQDRLQQKTRQSTQAFRRL